MKAELRDQRSEVRMRASVLECGDLSPLSAGNLSPLRVPPPRDQSRGPQSCDQSQHSKTWRLTSAVGPWAVLAARWGHRALPVGLLLFCLLSSVFCPLASAQYSIDWSTVDGGGGTSTGGVYAVSGTIGQPDAGTMSGGSFTLVGGFWALPGLVQTPGAPMLYITNAAPGWATLLWLPPTPGFVLQENLSLSSTNWVYSLSSTTNPVVVPATLPAKFYRLHKP